MGRETIKDKHFLTLGYIETATDGLERALDASYSLLGFYDPNRDVTLDAQANTVAEGNVLKSIICNKKTGRG
jgi:hypothetical protein